MIEIKVFDKGEKVVVKIGGNVSDVITSLITGIYACIDNIAETVGADKEGLTELVVKGLLYAAEDDE